MSTLRHWLWLSTRGPSPGMYAAQILDRFGSPETAFFAGETEYDSIPGLPRSVREALLDKSLEGADDILGKCDRLGIRVLTIQDTEYPERLRQLHTAPCVLYVKGRLPLMDEEAAVTIVGARRASPYGVETASQFGLGLARQGALVVSGSAVGVDSAAIKGALRGGGKVVSVLGNGIDVIYPMENRALYDDVAAAGALVSEYPPGTQPLPDHFPVRNRLLAGLSLGVLVVEGAPRSGSLITARWALEQDRDVFAIPGPISSELSKGPNGLIRRGEARLVTDVWDILGEYELLYPARIRPRAPLSEEAARARLSAIQTGKKPDKAPPAPVAEPEAPRLVIDRKADPEALTDDEAALLRALQGDKACTADDLVEQTGIPARRVLSALTMLQVRQLAQQGSGGRFTTQVILKE